MARKTTYRYRQVRQPCTWLSMDTHMGNNVYSDAINDQNGLSFNPET